MKMDDLCQSFMQQAISLDTLWMLGSRMSHLYMVTTCQSNQYLGTSPAFVHIGCRLRRIGGFPHQSPPMENVFSLNDQINLKDSNKVLVVTTSKASKTSTRKVKLCSLALVSSLHLRLNEVSRHRENLFLYGIYPISMTEYFFIKILKIYIAIVMRLYYNIKYGIRYSMNNDYSLRRAEYGIQKTFLAKATYTLDKKEKSL